VAQQAAQPAAEPIRGWRGHEAGAYLLLEERPVHVGRHHQVELGDVSASLELVYYRLALDHVNQVRLDAAARLLTEGNQSIASIAHATGFYDHSYFTKQFRAAKDMSPSAYRKHMIG
ncbi:MAG: helix-turn-helix transcriptional regulator, partial [bacterium]|nr:helix-turn-helix transcriptional regulator [bacterium]